jgi:KaiC/GvpD/RAD55 family RecA-like ATPase
MDNNLQSRGPDAAQRPPLPTWAPSSVAERSRASTGNPLLDHLLRGGLPRGSTCLLLGPPYSGKELIVGSYAAAAAAERLPLIVSLTNLPPAGFRALVARVGGGADFLALEDEGQVAYVDCYAGLLGEESRDPLAVAAPSPSEPESLLRAFSQARLRLGEPPTVGILLHGLTDVVLASASLRGREGMPWLQRLLSQCRRWNATTVMTAEQGIHPDSELSLFQHLSDLTIEFMEGSDARLFLRARGLGGAATRDWVEYTTTDQGLDITGSFTETKIR